MHPQCKRHLGGTLTAGTTGTRTFRVEPGPTKVLRTAAEREHRSVVNMVEMMTQDSCGPNWIDFVDIRSVKVSCHAIRC